jgi:CO/xanthine dehydrogenase Mo-binding subunit
MQTARNKKVKPQSFSSIGKSAPKIEGLQKVSGTALYTADNLIAGTIWGKVLRSPYAHARIVRVDASRLKSRPGVMAVITAADIPDLLTGRRLRDMPMLARDRARFIGEKVAVVAAEDHNIAEEAAQLIEVEYEPLPAHIDSNVRELEGSLTRLGAFVITPLLSQFLLTR